MDYEEFKEHVLGMISIHTQEDPATINLPDAWLRPLREDPANANMNTLAYAQRWLSEREDFLRGSPTAPGFPTR